jgi:hypothetical protein
VSALVLLAQEVAPAGFPVLELVNYGVLGLVVLAFVFGKIVPGYIYERRVQESADLRAENERIRTHIDERVMPALVRSTDLLSQYVEREAHRGARNPEGAGGPPHG